MNALLKELMERYPSLGECRADIERAGDLMMETYRAGGKIMVCGNGGSCADSDHIVGELMKGFLQLRPIKGDERERLAQAIGVDGEDVVSKLQGGIPAISLPAQAAVLSAFANDVDASLVYAQLVYGYARKGDLLIALSTSGNSKNVVSAAKVARAVGISTLALTGSRESKLSKLSDCTVRVPETETFKVQELHLPIYHYLCAYMENEIFGA